LSICHLGHDNSTSPLLRKHSAADALHQHIISGRISPGERIVEAHWGNLLCVAQASIREAINTLVQEGFIEKQAGRSARVTSLSPADIRQIYQLRAAMEGLAARLAAQHKANLTPMEEALQLMREAAQHEDLTAYYLHDLQFHVELCNCSGNRFLADQGRSLLHKLFAFYVLRLQSVRDDKDYWRRSLDEHELIITVIRRGHPGLAEQFLVAIIGKFYSETQLTNEGGIRPC